MILSEIIGREVAKIAHTPLKINRISMVKQYGKYRIIAYCDGVAPVTIGRYSDFAQAGKAMADLTEAIRKSKENRPQPD